MRTDSGPWRSPTGPGINSLSNWTWGSGAGGRFLGHPGLLGVRMERTWVLRERVIYQPFHLL